MHANDEIEFANALELCFANYGQPAPKSAVVLDWMKHLEPYTVMQVGNALEHHKRTSDYPPNLKSILSLMPPDPTDWPTAEEAFSEMLLIDGGRLAFVTQEHEAGMYVARPLLGSRANVSAAKAFEARYDALVKAERNAGRRAKWFLPPINVMEDQNGQYRLDAIKEAVRLGRITREDGVAHYDQLRPMLPGKTTDKPVALEGPSVKVQSEVEKVRALLNPNYEAKPAADDAPWFDLSAHEATKQQKADIQRATDELAEREAREKEATVAAFGGDE